MSRALRIEYENAWYHVMNRGANRIDIFKENSERLLFLTLLEQIHTKYKVEIHAYCLMNNHYHLLLKTPLANLSQAMHHLNGMYVQKHNKIHKTDGPLFRGRFKSIIVDAENYLLRLSRYIHLNPVKSNLTDKAASYPWSSCAAYLGNIEEPQWLYTNSVLAKFGDVLQRQKYKLFIEEGIDNELDTFFDKLKRLPVLGTKTFITTITEKYLKNKSLSSEVPEQNVLLKKRFLSLDELLTVVADYYQVDLEKLKITSHAKRNKPRSVAIYLATITTGQSLRVIANVFTKVTYSDISQIARKVRLQLEYDNNLRDEINKIKILLSNYFKVQDMAP